VVTGHARLCVCVCVSVCLTVRGRMPTCTNPDVTWGSGRGCPLVVHYLADLQSVHGLRFYGNTRNAWQSPAVIRQAHRTQCHALRMPANTAATQRGAARHCGILCDTIMSRDLWRLCWLVEIKIACMFVMYIRNPLIMCFLIVTLSHVGLNLFHYSTG